jgi:hypothetical protein
MALGVNMALRGKDGPNNEVGHKDAGPVLFEFGVFYLEYERRVKISPSSLLGIKNLCQVMSQY